MKIVFLIRSVDTAGPTRQMIELAHGLARQGWQVMVVTFYGGGPMEPDLIARGLALHVAGKRSRWDVFRFLWRLSRLLRQEQPDFLYGYTLLPNILAVLLKVALPKSRIVWGVRSSTNLCPNPLDWLNRSLFPASCLLSRFADLIICNSESGRSFHARRGYWQKRMVVIANGIDTTRFKPDAAARGEIRSEWGVRDDEILVGMVCRLDRRKDHPNFLRAAATLAKERNDLRFVCVGDGDPTYRDKLRRFASSLGLDGRLLWAGLRLDMPRVYNALDLAVSSSWTEGFPNVVAEAMATGVPCVVTDVGDSARIVGDPRRVCAARDTRSLTGVIRVAAMDLDRKACNRGALRERIEREFSVDRLVGETSRQLEAVSRR